MFAKLEEEEKFLSEIVNSGFIQMYCANCGVRVSGFKGYDGVVRISCPRCRVKIFSKQKSSKVIDIRLKTVN